MRNHQDVLHFRSDISPFLVHLTRSSRRIVRGGWEDIDASDVLEKIVDEQRLLCGKSEVSDARFGMRTNIMSEDDKKKFLKAICLTETPLNEVHCLLEIDYRNINLEPYGLVFLKDRLVERGVSPVLYFNNENGDKNLVFRALCSLAATRPRAAQDILPLMSVFGKKITPPGASTQAGHVDFRWEREWRYPHSKGPLSFTSEDVFIGLCPHGRISSFERQFPDVGFIDPRRNMKWYASKLIEARQRLDMKHSVV